MARPRAFDEDTVLDRALNLFWHQGYEATSMQQLIDALGINRASLYDTFGDKYTLYRRVLDRYRLQNQEFVTKAFGQCKPARLILAELFDFAIADAITDSQCKGCFMINSTVELAPHDPDIAQIVRDNQCNFVGQLQRVIQRGQTEGDINPAHPAEDLALFVFNTYSGLKILAKTNPDETALRSVVAVTMGVLTVS